MGDLPARRAALLHPAALGALAVLLLNDHVLKAAWPSWWTGKLSDVAALVVAPLALAAIGGWVAGRKVRHRDGDQDGRMLLAVGWVAAAGVGLSFVAAKLTPQGNAAYATIAGWFAWPVAVAGALLGGRPVPPLGPAPTVLDPSDLLALPALAVGAWLAIGAPSAGGARIFRPRTSIPESARPTFRIVIAGWAWFALAATSPLPPPSVLTAVMPDVAPLEAGSAPTERATSVTVAASQPFNGSATVDPSLSIRVQARPRWPPNDPPARFALSVAGVAAATGPAPVVIVPPATCWSGCRLDVTVAIDWPDGAGHGISTAAWELVATTDVTSRGHGPYSGAAPAVAIMGPAPLATGDPNALLVALFLVPLLGLRIGGTTVRRRLDRRPSGDRAPGAALATALVIVGAVVAFGIVVSTVPGTPLGANPWLVALAGLIGIGALVVGFVRWLGGSGALLVVAVIDLAILAIPIGGVLTGASSGVFSDRGLVLTVALAVALTVAGLLAPIRLDDRDRLATGERLVVLGAGLAVAVIFGLASNDSANGLIYLGCLQLAAIVAWWNGSGWLLGFTSLAGVVLVGLAVLVGHWTAAGALTQAGILSGSVIGLLAAFRQIGRHPTDPARRTEGQPGVGGDSEPDAPPTT